MAKQVAGSRYAQALFELAVQQDQAEPWAAELDFMAAALQDGEFNAFLKHAEVPLERKIAALSAVLPEVDPLVRNLGALLITRNAVDTVGDVAIGYRRRLDARLDRQQVAVTTAVELNAEETEQVRQFVAGLIRKEVALTARVDPAILGGIIIQIGDRLLDGSARAKLEGLRKQLRTEAAA